MPSRLEVFVGQKAQGRHYARLPVQPSAALSVSFHNEVVHGLRTNIVVATAAGWTIRQWGWQFAGGPALDEAYVPFLDGRARADC